MRSGALMILMSVAAVTPANSQGLFEALFGRAGSPSGPVVRYASREVGPVRRQAPRASLDVSREVRIPTLQELSEPGTKRLAEPAKPAPYVPPPVQPGPLGKFLRDPTLRAGDIVATENGLMVYRGPGGARHAEKQFAAVGSAKGLVGDKLPLLVKLDRELRRSPTVLAESISGRESPVVASDDRGSRRR